MTRALVPLAASVVFAAVLVFFAGCGESGGVVPAGAAAATPTATATQGPLSPSRAPGVRYLALGDSFTIGTGGTPDRAFPARLVDRWRGRGCSATLENVAVNGYTTEDIIATELPVVATFHPTFVTIAAGANDIVQGRTLDAYRVSVRAILDAVKASGARIVVVPQPDWSQSPAAAGFGTRESLGQAIMRFNAALAEEARAKGAEWADLVPLMREQAASGQLASDGLHPSVGAYDAWAGELARMLRSPCE